MPEAVLGLGGNLGARRAIFRAAIALLDAVPGCQVLARSRVYETPPLGPPQPDYLNAAVRIRFSGDVDRLLLAVQRIESQLGRERRERWGARTLDLDVLHWSDGPVKTATLEVPHPELETRTFALAPLLDVAPELGARLGKGLVALGGAPPLASPGWPELSREGSDVCGSWLRDELELASQLVELLATSPSLAGRADEAVVQHAGLGTHAFSGPSELFDPDGRSWLRAVVADALGRGFAVQMAAVLARDDTHTTGVLLGFDGGGPAQLGPLDVTLERRSSPDGQHELRVKMREDATECA